MVDLLPCAHCGHKNVHPYIQAGRGDGGVDRYRIICHTCGTMTDFFDAFVHSRDDVHAQEKAAKAWNRRSRVARSEELADLVAKFRSMLSTIQKGCMAKSKAAEAARDCVKQLAEDIELILPYAKKAEMVEHEMVDRARR